MGEIIMSKTIDGVPLDNYKKIAEKFYNKLQQEADKSKFCEKLLIGLEVVKDKGIHSAKAVYIGKDSELHNETFTFTTPKEYVDHIINSNYFGDTYMAKSYTDRDLGVFTVLASNGVSFRANVAKMGRLAFNNKEVSDLCEQFKLADYHISMADSKHMYDMCEQANNYIDDFEKRKTNELNDEIKPAVDLVYNERNWNEDFGIRMNREYAEFSYSFEDDDKLYLSSDSLDIEKTTSFDFLNLKENLDKKNTAVMFGNNQYEVLFAKSLPAMSAFLEAHTDTYYTGEYEVVNQLCKAGTKALELKPVEKANLRATAKEISNENSLNH